MPSIRQEVLRTLSIGAFLMATVPGAAVWATQPHPPKSIVLKMQMTPAEDNPAMVGR